MSPSASVAATAAPMFRPAGVFSATLRVAVVAPKSGRLFACTALSDSALAVLPLPCPSV